VTEHRGLKVFSFLASFFFVLCAGIYLIDRRLGGDEPSLSAVIVRGALISLVASPFIYLYFRGKGADVAAED
jgi:hypothetical protein